MRRPPAIIFLAVAFVSLARPSVGAQPTRAPEAWRPLSTPIDERSIALTGDGRTAYFGVRVGDGYLQAICEIHRTARGWSTPTVLPFSGGPAFDGDPFVTPDGRTLYFTSSRDGRGGVKPDLDIWVARRGPGGWGAPERLPGAVNTKGNERSPVLVASGRLYFSATLDGRSQLFVAEPGPAGFGPPRPLGDGVNGDGDNPTLAVDRAETTLVFASLGRADEALFPGQIYPRGDLYLSRRQGDVWEPARRLPAPINSVATELSPWFSPDGRWLYFTSERSPANDPRRRMTWEAFERLRRTALNGRGNIWRIPARDLQAAP